MKVCSLLVLAVVAVACCAEDPLEGTTTGSPPAKQKVGDLKSSESFGFGYHGGYPNYGGHYGYPNYGFHYGYPNYRVHYGGYPSRFYGGYPNRFYSYPYGAYYGRPYRKSFGYPYFGLKAYPLAVWG